MEFSIGDIIQERYTQKPKHKSERNEVLSEIYLCYQNDKQNRKKENWKRYCLWCRENKMPKGSEKLFKKTKFFLKELTPKVVAIKLAHIPTKDLYYIKSIVKDKYNRGENVGAYLLGSLKCK